MTEKAADRSLGACALCEKPITSASQEAEFKGDGCIPNTQMADGFVFDHGMSGVFRFKTNHDLKEGDVICGACLKARVDDIEPCVDVICGVCQKAHHREFSGCATQGAGCAAEVGERRFNDARAVFAGYGSRRDGTMFLFTDENAALPVGTLVCDECIAQLVKDGKIREYDPPMHEMRCTFREGCDRPVVAKGGLSARCRECDKQQREFLKRFVDGLDADAAKKTKSP